tara:strand:- start:8789 stop:9085 length:297 start_codon:yes stop_codon:yes gene_type:complete
MSAVTVHKSLREAILYHVDQHSGGIKFTLLLSNLLSDTQEDLIEGTRLFDNPVLQIEKAIQEIDELHTLHYGMTLGRMPSGKIEQREKMFVYRPLTEE